MDNTDRTWESFPCRCGREKQIEALLMDSGVILSIFFTFPFVVTITNLVKFRLLLSTDGFIISRLYISAAIVLARAPTPARFSSLILFALSAVSTESIILTPFFLNSFRNR